MRNPLEKQIVATSIAQRGPLASTLVPNTAADSPSITMPSVNGSALSVPAAGLPSRSVDSSGILNTLQAYAWPIARWIDSAAGGISHLLQPGGATIRSRWRNPTAMTDPLHPTHVRVNVSRAQEPCNSGERDRNTSCAETIARAAIPRTGAGRR